MVIFSIIKIGIALLDLTSLLYQKASLSGEVEFLIYENSV